MKEKVMKVQYINKRIMIIRLNRKTKPSNNKVKMKKYKDDRIGDNETRRENASVVAMGHCNAVIGEENVVEIWVV